MVLNLNHPGNFGAVKLSSLPPLSFWQVVYFSWEYYLSFCQGGLHVSLWFGHQANHPALFKHYLNSPNLDPGIGQEGNSLIKFKHLQGIICQPFLSKFIIVYISCNLVLHEIISFLLRIFLNTIISLQLLYKILPLLLSIWLPYVIHDIWTRF